MADDPLKDVFDEAEKHILGFIAVIGLVLFFIILVLFAGCTVLVPKSEMDIPDKPTIWTDSAGEVVTNINS